MEIVCELSGANGADKLKQPGSLVVAVDIYYVVDSLGCCSHSNQLEIDKRHMVAADHIRGLKTIHVDLFNLMLLVGTHDLGKHLYKPSEVYGLPYRIFCRFIPFFVLVINFHKKVLFFFTSPSILNYLTKFRYDDISRIPNLLDRDKPLFENRSYVIWKENNKRLREKYELPDYQVRDSIDY